LKTDSSTWRIYRSNIFIVVGTQVKEFVSSSEGFRHAIATLASSAEANRWYSEGVHRDMK
jgi:hypothetical protein